MNKSLIDTLDWYIFHSSDKVEIRSRFKPTAECNIQHFVRYNKETNTYNFKGISFSKITEKITKLYEIKNLIINSKEQLKVLITILTQY
jgi:hypothetical protein